MILKEAIKHVLPRSVFMSREMDWRKETHINRAILHCHGATYMEIGVHHGVCFRQIQASRKIGIDTKPLPVEYSLASGESFFNMKSDEFFALHSNEVLEGQSVDVALVDGLHEFAQALRDVLNLERFMSPRGVIFIHDCNPTRREYAEEYREGIWNGDVWKVAYYLRAHRRDLRFLTLDCDYGLGVLLGFNDTRGAKPPTQDVLAQIKKLDYEFLEKGRKQILRLRPAWYSRILFSDFGALA